MPEQHIDKLDYSKREVLEVNESYPELKSLSGDAKLVFDQWLTLRGQNDMPLFADFLIDSLPFGIIPWTIIYDVINEGADFQYRFFGTQRVNAHQEDYIGRYVSAMKPEEIRDKILGELRYVYSRGEPNLITTTAQAYGEVFQYKMLRMPYSGDAKTVARIVAITFDGTGPELNPHLMRGWYKERD